MKSVKPQEIEKNNTLKKFSFLLNLLAKLITIKPRIMRKKGLNISEK